MLVEKVEMALTLWGVPGKQAAAANRYRDLRSLEQGHLSWVWG